MEPLYRGHILSHYREEHGAQGQRGWVCPLARVCTVLTYTWAPFQAHLPFAVVDSTEEVKVGNKLVRARQYPWGVVQGECGGESTALVGSLDSVPCPVSSP